MHLIKRCTGLIFYEILYGNGGFSGARPIQFVGVRCKPHVFFEYFDEIRAVVEPTFEADISNREIFF